MPADPWADFEEVSAAPSRGADPWAGFEEVSAPVQPGYLRGASSIGPTPWYRQGVFSQGIPGVLGPGIVEGPSVQGILDAAPAVGGAIGGALGAGSGAFAGLGLGAAPGAVGGAAFGGEAGEAARQLGRRAVGAYAPRTSAEAATEIGHQGAIQAVAEVVGRGVPVAVNKGVRTLLAAPEKQYAQALGATTLPNKEISERIVPELIRRRVTGSREGLKSLAERQVGEQGARIDVELAKMPKGQAADVGAVMNRLQALKREYVVPSSTPGYNTIVDQTAYDNLSRLQKLVGSTQPTFESVRRLRQILDSQVTAGNKAFGRTLEEGTKLDATREAANAIRGELAKVNPNVALINKEFSFWSDVDRVLGDTLTRTSSQARPLGQTIAEAVAAPAIAGAAAGGDLDVAATVAIPVLLRKIIVSPQWKTFSAVQKDRLADAIARGDAQRIGSFLSHVATRGLVADDRTELDDQP